MSGDELVVATGGRWHGVVPEVISGISTDTREFVSGQAFLALRGPHFDGHAFAASVADRAEALIGDHAGVRQWSDLDNSKLEVADTLKAFGDIAHAWRMRLKHTAVVAVTGSFGKTTLRSILETGFSALGVRVSATYANLNNLIGVPKTLLSVPLDADVAVIECGISETGEMARLAAMVQPDIAVLTGIAEAHSEGLGGLSGVVKEKALLLEHLNENGWCALAGGVEKALKDNGVALPGQALIADSEAEETVRWRRSGCELLLEWRDEAAALKLALPAEHWAANIAFAVSIILRYLHGHGKSTSLAAVVDAVSSWAPPSGRMQQCDGIDGSLVLNDCYNANPASMQAALDTLRAIYGRRVAILGDMGELGEGAEVAHGSLDLSKIDDVYLIGHHMKQLADKYPAAKWFATTDEAATALKGELFAEGDVVLVKASRAMRLEAIVTLLCGEGA